MKEQTLNINYQIAQLSELNETEQTLIRKAMEATQDFIFELYLKGNHVAEGRKSYSGVIGLILAWEEKKEYSRKR